MDKKVLREIWSRKLRSLLIIGIVSVTLGLLIGMRAGYPMIMATYRENLRENNVADGRFTFNSPIMEQNVSILQDDADFLVDHQIDRIEGRISILSELIYNEEKFPAIIIGIEFPNSVNQLVIEQNDPEIDPQSDFLHNSTNCILESRFAGDLIGQNIPLNSKLDLNIGGEHSNFTAKAIGADTDFLYVVDPVSQMTLIGQMAIVWIDLAIMQEILFDGAPLINQMLFTVEDRLNRNMALDAADVLSQEFALHEIDISTIEFTLFDETLDRTFFDADAGAIDKMGTIFGIIGLIVCSVAIFNTLSRLVQAQKRNIGLFMSMGAKKSKIITHYIKVTMVLASIGVIIGLPLGYGLSVGMTKLVVRFYALQHFLFPITYSEFIFGTLATLFVCAIFSGISAIPVTRVTPREAMSAFYNRIKVTKQTISEKIFSWIPGFRNILMLVPIREIFLRKRKSAITILAITTSMIILINSLAMEANMYSTVVDNYEKYNTADIHLRLENPVPKSQIDQFMANQSEIKIPHYEVYISLYTKLSFNEEFKTWTELQCYQANSTLRNFNIIRGDIDSKHEIGSNEIILGQSLASKYNIALGDTIKIGTLANYSLAVNGFVGELIDFSAFWTLEAFQNDNISQYFGLPTGFVNGIMFNVGDDVDLLDLRQEFEASFSVSQWVDAEQSRQSVMNLMQTMMSVLLLFLAIGIGIGILFSFNTMYMGFISRENDFLAFKAMGTKPKHIRRMIFWENAILSLFSLIITIPVGYFAYWQSMDYMIGDRFYMPLSIPLYTWPAVFLLSLLSIWLATRRMMKKINKMVLADELRQREIT